MQRLLLSAERGSFPCLGTPCFPSLSHMHSAPPHPGPPVSTAQAPRRVSRSAPAPASPDARPGLFSPKYQFLFRSLSFSGHRKNGFTISTPVIWGDVEDMARIRSFLRRENSRAGRASLPPQSRGFRCDSPSSRTARGPGRDTERLCWDPRGPPSSLTAVTQDVGHVPPQPSRCRCRPQNGARRLPKPRVEDGERPTRLQPSRPSVLPRGEEVASAGEAGCSEAARATLLSSRSRPFRLGRAARTQNPRSPVPALLCGPA